MGLLEDLTNDVVRDFVGMKDVIVDEISGKADDLMIRRLQKNYDRIPVPALEAIRDNLGHSPDETKPCRACRVIADEEFKRAEFE